MAYNITIKSVKGMINADVWADNIDAPLLQTAFNKLDYSDEYLSTIKSIFNMVFEYTRRMGYGSFNPMADVIIEKTKNPVRTSETRKQVLRT